jgi:hypothetical protein
MTDIDRTEEKNSGDTCTYEKRSGEVTGDRESKKKNGAKG